MAEGQRHRGRRREARVGPRRCSGPPAERASASFTTRASADVQLRLVLRVARGERCSRPSKLAPRRFRRDGLRKVCGPGFLDFASVFLLPGVLLAERFCCCRSNACRSEMSRPTLGPAVFPSSPYVRPDDLRTATRRSLLRDGNPRRSAWSRSLELGRCIDGLGPRSKILRRAESRSGRQTATITSSRLSPHRGRPRRRGFERCS